MTDNEVTAEKEGWEFLTKLPDRSTPFWYAGAWWIIKNGKAIEVNIKQ